MKTDCISDDSLKAQVKPDAFCQHEALSMFGPRVSVVPLSVLAKRCAKTSDSIQWCTGILLSSIQWFKVDDEQPVSVAAEVWQKQC